LFHVWIEIDTGDSVSVAFKMPLQRWILLKKNKCDVICENLPYGGTNNVLLYQLFSHVCESIYVETAEGATAMFAVYVPERKKTQAASV